MSALLNINIARQLTAASFLRIDPTIFAQMNPYIARERAAAAAMSDDEYWNWDRLYAAVPGVLPPTLHDLTQQGDCGGGGCNPSFANSQFWQANVACSADVYGRVLFQYRRYVAAQIRLQALIANPPQTWPGQMYFADAQDSDGASTTSPTRPGGEMPLSSKASEWADWCFEVMANVAVAQWASGVRWCNADRSPTFYGGLGVGSIGARAGGRVYIDPTGYGKMDNPYGSVLRPMTPSEWGTVAGCQGISPLIIQALTDRAAQENALYEPDCAREPYGSYHPIGYFRPTAARGSAPARWTWGIAPDVDASTSWGVLGRSYPSQYVPPKGVRGISEPFWSPRPESQLFRAFRRADGPGLPVLWTEDWAYPHNNYYTATFLQLAECLATRHGNGSGTHTFVMPENKSDFDPILTPSLIQGGTHLVWPDDLFAPTDTSPRGVLTALFREATQNPTGPFDSHTLTLLRSQWALGWSSGGSKFLPTGLRQIWWCMAQAYDVIDTPMGTVVSQAFGNFLTGLNQIPPTYRVLDPTEGGGSARAALQGSLDGIFAACSATASAIGTAASLTGPVGAVVGAVVGALVALAGALAQQAFAVGLARAGDPPVMPTIMMRVAGATNDPTDPCWLVSPSGRGGGGAAAMVPKATAVQAAAAHSESPAEWYAQVQQAIATGAQPPPPTTAQVNKGVALAGGAIAGLALMKLLGG